MSSTSSTQTISGIGLDFNQSSSSSSSTSSLSSLNANSFMTLFLAQLQNQDPTNPMDSSQLAAQLAQFTTVQELDQANTYLGNLQQYSTAINNAEITSLVGKDVTAQRSEIDVSSGSGTALSYTLPEAATVTVTIKDSNGNTVNTLNVGSENAGTYTVPWDCTDSSGSTVSDGAYTVTVTATTSGGTSSTIQPYVTGTVESCDLSASPPTYLLSDGITIPVSNVYKVADETSSS